MTLIKTITLTLFLFFWMGGFAEAKELPSEVKVLCLKRDKKVAQLEKKYAEDLDKLQAKYTGVKRYRDVSEVAKALKEIKEGKLRIRDEQPSELKAILRKRDASLEKIGKVYFKELQRLKTKFQKAADLKAALAVDELINQHIAKLNAKEGLCTIEVEVNIKVVVRELVLRRTRLSGGYQPRFEEISDVVLGKDFIRVPWRSTPVYEGKVIKSGNLYILCTKKNAKEIPQPKEKVPGLVGGPYLKDYYFYRVYLKAGEKFKYQGYEMSMIAEKISVRGL